ncbi:MAG: hypothetical protein LBT79_06295 [Elusimicrobiota bacterium]|jgi:hypothetical protein|nr:hypothetical protein [Elusimicrobiota bacterium]
MSNKSQIKDFYIDMQSFLSGLARAPQLLSLPLKAMFFVFGTIPPPPREIGKFYRGIQKKHFTHVMTSFSL